jgi:hypothetical protein
LPGDAVNEAPAVPAGQPDDLGSNRRTAIVKPERQEGWVLLLATSGYRKLAVDTVRRRGGCPAFFPWNPSMTSMHCPWTAYVSAGKGEQKIEHSWQEAAL